MKSRLKLLTRLLPLLTGLAATPLHAAVFKIATIAPEGSNWMTQMRSAGKEIQERTEGRVEVKYYGGGIMGNDKKVLRKIRIGQLHGGAFTVTALIERYPDMSIYGLPLIFRSEEEVDFVRSHIDQRLITGLEDIGFIGFGFASGGFARILSNQPVRTQADLSGRKIWVPEGDQISYRAMQAMELSPVVLPITDVLTGLQTGLLDVVATPPVGAVVLQWYTKVSYMADLPVTYAMGLLVVDEKAFNRISDADQLVFREVMERMYADFDRQNRSDNLEAEAALAANGIKTVAVDPEQAEQWRQITLEAAERMSNENLFSAELLEEVKQLLEEHRAGAAATAPIADSSPIQN